MSVAPFHIEARLSATSFALCERIEWTLVVANHGKHAATVPDAERDGPALTLKLRRPAGSSEVVQPGMLPPPPGAFEDSSELEIGPGDKAEFSGDLTEHFHNLEPGSYAFQIEYTLDDGRTWRSRELLFELDPPTGSVLDVTPNEAAAAGRHGVVWAEHGRQGPRALLFDDDGWTREMRGAEQMMLMSEDAAPALSTSPAGIAWDERWVAWIARKELHIRFYAHGDPNLELVAPPVPLPSDAVAPELVRPLLAEAPLRDGRPRCTIPLFAARSSGGRALYLLEASRQGHVTTRTVVPIADAAVGCWGTAPTAAERVFTFVLGAPHQLFVFGVHAPWDHPCSLPARWFTIEADAFLLADLRSTLEGQVRMGLLARRGDAWERIVLALPAIGRSEATVIHRSSLSPPTGAEPVRARLDGAGGLHLLYRRKKELAYVPHAAPTATWTNDRLGALAPATAHLDLCDPRRVIVGYDPDRGPVWHVL